MGKRFLVVDDEEVVLGAVCKALKKAETTFLLRWLPGNV
jgi:hypothetical protein